MGTKKYKIIYADPPWSDNSASKKGTSRGVAERYYNVMGKAYIENLKIEETLRRWIHEAEGTNKEIIEAIKLDASEIEMRINWIKINGEYV